MKPTSIAELVQCTKGRLIQGDMSDIVLGVTIDQRTVKPGDAFVAFVGARVDGHTFVPAAFAQGATLAIVTQTESLDCNGLRNILLVDDARVALARMANYDRRKFSGPVIGVTGSNGKTTTKEMIATIFQALGPCHYTTGNYNNELGLPLTILQRNDLHGSMVLEMGMRGRGQIEALCQIAAPTSGIITNIGQSHLELLGTQENIALAKAELIQSLPPDGLAVLCHDDQWSHVVAELSSAPISWYSTSTPCDAYATHLEQSTTGMSFTAHIYDSRVDVQLPTFGTHNVRNALGAMLLGAHHNIPLSAMAHQLTLLQSTSGRLRVLEGANGCSVIDDCYNASPLSMKASLQVLSALSTGRRSVAILGDMYELGSYQEAGHREVGAAVSELEVDFLIAVGPLAADIAAGAMAAGHRRVRHVPDTATLLAKLSAWIQSSDVVLVKASRGMHLETIVEALLSIH